jgi:hypothetical protein
MPPEWNLLFTLPNLAPPIPTPYESGGCVICSAADERLDNLADNPGNRTARRMLLRFRTTRSERYQPGCLLIRKGSAPAVAQAETLRAFRNVCAIATTTSAYVAALQHPHAAQWRVSWSDQFLFGYFTPGRSGWVQTLDGPVRGMDDVIPRSQAAPRLGIQHIFVCCSTSRCWSVYSSAGAGAICARFNGEL